MTISGYTGKLLRVDLSRETTTIEPLDPAFIAKWVGGVGFAARLLWEEMPADVAWSDPRNRLIWTTGPLAGSGVYGAGTVNIAAKGPMTNLAGCSQANGYFGAYLKFSGFDGIVFKGRADRPVYLSINAGKAEIKPAVHLWGADIFQTEARLREELSVKGHKVSIYAIGPAGENRVRHAAIGGDGGHFAAHNGLGAVMGSKNLKAVVAYLGKPGFTIDDPETLRRHNNAMLEHAKGFGHVYKWGTAGGFSGLAETGGLPVKNYTTNLFDGHEKMNGQYMRNHYKHRSRPCYRCRIAHVKEITVTEGPYKGFVAEEPEYEQVAAWGPQIGNHELGAVVMLAREVDRLGLDCNESSWAIGWAMECYEKGILSRGDLDGLDLTWGNVAAVREILNKIANRDGVGDLLADGVMRAARKVGRGSEDLAIHTLKGSAPRSHDHRGGKWAELFDTCLTNTSTLEATWVGVHPQLVDQPPATDPFSHEEVARINGSFNGVRQFDDCLGTCRFCATDPKLQLACLNAVTGWQLELADIFSVGRRIVNQLRLFNLRHGLTKAMERPSKRYGSAPVDGPAKGRDVMMCWGEMLEIYYRAMGWDQQTGVPLPETLSALGLEELAESV